MRVRIYYAKREDKSTQRQQSNEHTMKEQLELHISWEGKGISLKSLSNILKGFDDINDTLSNNKEERAFVKEVDSGSINIVLASLAMGTLKTAPEIYYFLRNLSNKTFQKDYKEETLKLASTFIANSSYRESTATSTYHIMNT